MKFIQSRRLRDRQLAVKRMFGESSAPASGHQYLGQKRHKDLKSFLKSMLRLLMPINLKMNRPFNDEVIYCWGCIPAFGRYVVDLDNVYSLAGYNLSRFRVSKVLIALLLSSRRCVGIRAISAACKRSVTENFGAKIGAKTTVIYPCEGLESAQKPKQFNGKIFFVGSQFSVKGGKILVKFIDMVNQQHPECSFVVVAHVPEQYRKKLERNETVTTLKPEFTRLELLDYIQSEASVLFHPSLMESFGMVILEALSVGVPALSFDFYNLPELVVNGRSGFNVHLVESKWVGVTANPEAWHSDQYYEISDETADEYASLFAAALDQLIADYDTHSTGALKHFNELKQKTLTDLLNNIGNK